MRMNQFDRDLALQPGVLSEKDSRHSTLRERPDDSVTLTEHPVAEGGEVHQAKNTRRPFCERLSKDRRILWLGSADGDVVAILNCE